MSLIVTRAETQPNHSTAVRADGRHLEQSTRMSSGTFETPHGVMEWDKYFITNHTLKRREDFVVICSRDVPLLDETFARLNRATTLGKRVVRQASVVLGARSKPRAAATEDGEACDVRGIPYMEFRVEFPLTVPELADAEELDIKEDGEGLYWLRLSNRHFDLFASNPATSEDPSFGVFIPTETPGVSSADPDHLRWQYADALLTPTTADLPGVLGDVSLRAALLDLKPGVTTV